MPIDSPYNLYTYNMLRFNTRDFHHILVFLMREKEMQFSKQINLLIKEKREQMQLLFYFVNTVARHLPTREGHVICH